MAAIRFHNPSDMPVPASAYSQMAEVVGPGRRLLLSGQIGVAPGGAIAEGYEAQARQAWSNIRAGLEAAGMTMADVVMVRVYDVAPGRVADYRRLRDEALGGHRPASTYVVVAGLAHPDFLTEIEVEAFRA